MTADLVSPLTRAAARGLVDQVRADMLERMGETDGWCEVAAGLLAARLIDVPEATLRYGSCGYGHHWWVTVGDLRLDPTSDQFRDMADLPPVCKDLHKRTWYHTQGERPITVETVRQHLNAIVDAHERHFAQWQPILSRCRHQQVVWGQQSTVLPAMTALAREALKRIDG